MAQGEDTGGRVQEGGDIERIQEEGYRREDSGRMVQGEDSGGRVQVGGYRREET
jgi:hypothetical protein